MSALVSPQTPAVAVPAVTVTVTDRPVPELDVAAVVVGVAAGPDGPVPLGGTAELDAALSGRLAAALGAVGATGKADEVVRFATLGAIPAPTVLAVGLGEPAANGAYPHEVLRRASGAATQALAGTGRVATTLALATGTPTPAELRAVTEGSLFGAYAFDGFRTRPADCKPPVGHVVVVADAASRAAAESGLARASLVAEAVHLVRNLVNTPPGHLSPARLAELACDHGADAGLTTEVLDSEALLDGGFGGILGVGQGSANPPRLIRLDYAGGIPGAPALALVGKGITFDSGGLSLKPATAMEWMKTDMAGAAAVLAAIVAIARAGLPLNVTAWLPTAENMPSGHAIRPSDVLTLRGGTRVEVLNTDAEGRLVLGDALARAAEEKPAMIVDVATLTGAQIVALGNRTTGLMGDEEAVRAVAAAAATAGEAVWPMPMPPELRKVLDSVVADIANVAGGGGRDGGMLVAAHFLRAFVPEGVPWAHLDVAGPSWHSGEPYGYTPKGGTGVAVRTLFQLAEDMSLMNTSLLS
jgi:leucyl aminopeptidase